MSSSEQKELSTGLIIAGAYADKVRRTLFAQLRDLVKQDKEFAREVARAAAELNIVLYNILVNELKIDKGDVVRARIAYTVEPSKRIKWFYDTLRLEVFRRVPDSDVSHVVGRVIREKLNQILESFRLAPKVAEEAVKAFEVVEEEEKAPPTPPAPPAPPQVPEVRVQVARPPVAESPLDYVGSVDIIGETVDGGYIARFASKEGSSMGIASLTPMEGEVVVDAVIIHAEKCYRYLTRVKAPISVYVEEPGRILSDLKTTKPTEIPKDQATSLIKEKMQSLI